MAKTAFSDEAITDLETLMDSLGYSQYLETKKSGGSISRYYGNLVFGFPSAGGIIPYITAGIGITFFKIEKI